MSAKKTNTIKSLEGRPLALNGLLESIRLGEGVSQAVFAKRLGVSVSHLCDIEKEEKW